MEKATRIAQSQIAKSEKDKRRNHNISLAHGIFLNGIFRWFGQPKPPKIRKVK